jgi:alkylation response protein AidB-like acyl-CoA dehydrogenase
MPGSNAGRRKLLGDASRRRRASAHRVWASVPDQPDYWRLWLVGVMVFGVRWLEMLAVAVFAFQRTGSPFVVAALTILRMLPMALFGAVIGAAAERLERRNALVFVVLSMLLTSLSLALLAATGTLAVWHLAVASVLNGIGWTSDNPVRRAMIGEVVGADRMSAAMAIDVGANNASQIVGPALGRNLRDVGRPDVFSTRISATPQAPRRRPANIRHREKIMSSNSFDLDRADTGGIDYVERARALAPMLKAAADEIEERRQLPDSVVEALIESGFFRLLLPRSLGGAELHPLKYVQVLEEIARAEPSTAWCLGQNSGCSMSAPYLDPAVAREIFEPRRGILAWGPELPGAGRGLVVAGGIRVTGRWGFATGSRHATWLGAHVPLFSADGTPRLNPSGRQAVRTALFPKATAEITDNWQVIGLRGTGSDSYAVEDLLVPQKFTFTRDDPAERRESGPLYKFTSGMVYAMGFSNVSLGIARGALEALVELARDKIPRGARHPLRHNNVVQSLVAQCEAKLRSSRAYVRSTLCEMCDEAERCRDFAPEQHARLRLAATWAIQQSREVVADIYSAAGATAIFNENPFERRFRDMHAGSQQGQGRPVHFETVGQILLGLPPEGRMFR